MSKPRNEHEMWTRHSVREVASDSSFPRFEVVSANGRVIASTLTHELAQSYAALFDEADDARLARDEQRDVDLWQ